MRIRILGCSGGIGGGARTTALLVDHDVLVDAGTGVADLPLSDLASIDHVLLTHAHLDHVTCIPFMLDSVGVQRSQPLVVHAQAATLEVLRRHLFNDSLWPDFTRIPSIENPFVRFEPLVPGGTLELGGRRFTSIPVTHSIPAVGYLIDSGGTSLAFSGDTTTTLEFWRVLNRSPGLRHVIIETSFTDAEEQLSHLSGHLCPRLLAAELAKFEGSAEIHITHLMPGEEEQILSEIRAQVPDRPLRALRAGTEFRL